MAILLRSVLALLPGLVCVILLVAHGGQAHASTTFPASRFAAIVVDDATGAVLYERNADARRYPASLTKVMTVYLAYEAIERGDLKMTDTIVISRRAAAQPPSKLGLRVGERITVAKALDILVVKSANDVATALAERIAGSEAAFARQMTRRARQLGMTQTTFRNASGLPDSRHVSTARDLALLAQVFLRDQPQAYRIFDQEKTTFRGRTISGHNSLLRRSGIDGFKTGFTRASGFNLMTSGVRNGHRVIAVVLGGRTAMQRDTFMRDLLRASFAALVIRDGGVLLNVAELLGTKDPFPAAETLALASTGVSEGQRAASRGPAQGDGETETQGPRSVQVGAFRTSAQAQASLAVVARRHAARIEGASPRVTRVGRLFGARFVGLSATEAGALCDSIVKRGGDCLVMAAQP